MCASNLRGLCRVPQAVRRLPKKASETYLPSCNLKPQTESSQPRHESNSKRGLETESRSAGVLSVRPLPTCDMLKAIICPKVHAANNKKKVSHAAPLALFRVGSLAWKRLTDKDIAASDLPLKVRDASKAKAKPRTCYQLIELTS